MIPEGYAEYKRREYCKDIKCSRQAELDSQTEGSPAYEAVRAKCRDSCLFTTYQFHHWLIDKGYLIVKPQT